MTVFTAKILPLDTPICRLLFEAHASSRLYLLKGKQEIRKTVAVEDIAQVTSFKTSLFNC